MTQKPILCSAFLSILLILGIVFLWLPKYQALIDEKSKIKKKEIELQNKDKNLQKLKEFDERIEDYSLELAKMRAAIPSLPDVCDFSDFIIKIALENGLVIEGINFGTPVSLSENPDIKKTQFSISLSGSYSDFKNFLFNPQNPERETLQNSSRIIYVEEISFSSPIKEEIFSFNLKVSTHSY